MFLSEFLKHLQMLQNHSVKIQITSFHIHSNPESSWVLYYEHVGFQLKVGINFSLSNQLPGLIQFQKKQHLLGAYCVSCMVTGRNLVSELSLKSCSHILHLLPYGIIPTVVLCLLALFLYILYLLAGTFVSLSGKLMSVLHYKEYINISQDLSKKKKKKKEICCVLAALDFFVNNASVSAGSKQ